MKLNAFFICIPLLLSFWACEEKEVPVFSDGHEIYFDKFYMNEFSPGTAGADSTVASFFFYPTGTEQIKVGLVVNLSGILSKEDLRYGVKVVEEGTTANEDEYELPDDCVFHVKDTYPIDAKEVQDTLWITLKRTDRMENMINGVRLVLELVPSDQLGLGQFERRRAILISTVVAAQPEWWNTEVELALLGKYSSKKYKLFLDNADINAELNGDLIKNHPDKAIQLVMRFKEWLNAQNPPVLDEDGSIMEVKI